MADSRDVAKAAGVSVATVSRVFNQPNIVSPQTQALVRQAAEALHYVPNQAASSLKSNKSRFIGLVVPEMRNPFYMQILHIISQRFRAQGYKLLVTFSNHDPAEEKQCLLHLIACQVEVIIFTPCRHDAALEQLLLASGIYVLQLYAQHYATMDSLLINDLLGTQLGFDHLYAHGHRRFLLFSTDLPGYVRYAAFDALIRAKPDIDSRILRIDLDADAAPLLEKTIAAFQPTCIFSIAYQASYCCFQTLRRLGLSIPHNISVVVYDDMDYAALNNITVIGHRHRELGETICQMVSEKLTRPSAEAVAPRQLMLDPTLVVRNSVAAL